MGILDVFFPKRCFGCGKLGRYFCERCKLTMRVIGGREVICPVCEKPAVDGATHPRCRTRYTIDGLTSFFRYEGIVRKAVKALKYRLVSDLALDFINLIPPNAFNNLTIQQYNNYLLVPIPLHPSRQRQRGFNQAEVLGRIMAERLGLSMKTDILRRVKKTTPQVEMKDRDKRLQNMTNVFTLFSNVLISQSLKIFLFDDVFTTGATMRSAANTLKRAGAPFVWGITMAR